MSELRLHFAENLKLLLRKEKSIAHVCRVLDINRQQFNRYLSGESLPGKRNLKKIAQYFKISEASLISSAGGENNGAESFHSEPLFERLFSAFNSGATSLRDGFYSHYIPALADKQKCLRGLMILKSEPSRTRFDAALSLRPAETGWRSDSLIRYSGLVRESAGKILFLGTSFNDPGDVFIVNVEPFFAGHGNLFTGISTSARADGISARRIAVEYAAEQGSLLALARKTGICSLDDEDISPRVRTAISPDNENDPPALVPKDRSNIVTS
jgi:transcriptional regulator with XRE-family HTH domain